MSEKSRPGSIPVLQSVEWRVDSACERFEQAWRAGRRPALDDHLPAEDWLRRAVLVELAHMDLECRLKAGEPARAEDYLSRYPELAGEPSTAWV
jgi:hypothetical protein